MTNLLWQADPSETTDDLITAFLSGDDVVLDRTLLPYDIRATAGHVRGLSRIGVISESDAKLLCDLLERLETDFQSGAFVLDERFEDGHSAIEFYLTKHAGDVGEKVHAGRSRNDQVLVASRLYLKDALARLIDLERAIGLACLQRAEADTWLPMPGYTHLQRAVPSSVGMWMAGFAEALADSLEFTSAVAATIDANPLGTAAGYGVNLPLDRDGVTEELGFDRLQLNPVNVQNSRGKYEVMALQAASHALHDVQRLAWDLSLFTTTEFGFVSLPQQYITGSSIMPNKRNPDVVELLRARPATIDACIQEILSITSLPSGYHRDLQFTKAPMIRGMSTALQALAVVPGLVHSMAFDADRMRDSISSQMYSTDSAIELTAQGEPFRSAYRKVKQELETKGDHSPGDSLRKRVSPGASGDLRLNEIRQRLVSGK